MQKSLGNSLRSAVALIAFAPFFATIAFADDFRSGTRDPGVRPGTPGAGCYLPGLNPTEQAFFFAAGGRFGEVDSVAGQIATDSSLAAGLPPGSGTTAGSITFCFGSTTQAAVTQPRQPGAGLGPD